MLPLYTYWRDKFSFLLRAPFGHHIHLVSTLVLALCLWGKHSLFVTEVIPTFVDEVSKCSRHFQCQFQLSLEAFSWEYEEMFMRMSFVIFFAQYYIRQQIERILCNIKIKVLAVIYVFIVPRPISSEYVPTSIAFSKVLKTLPYLPITQMLKSIPAK